MYSLLPSGIYNFKQYAHMFNLSKEDLSTSILSYPSSISSFNAEAAIQGFQVTSADSFFNSNPDIVATQATRILEQTKCDIQDLLQEKVVSGISQEKYITGLEATVNLFLQDFPDGLDSKRYIPVSHSPFPFHDHEFDIALCCAFCFSNKDESRLSPGEILKELLRVSKEVRIFPLLNQKGEVNDMWGPVMHYLQNNHFGQEVKAVEFEDNNEDNAMLRVWSTECMVN